MPIAVLQMPKPDFLFPAILVIFLAIGIHEYAHAKAADMAGDPTPRMHGRVTLNLFNHFDPLGSIMILLTVLSGFGIGWGRPVPMNPSRMRNPRWDHFTAVAAGPVSNLLQAGIYAILLRLALQSGVAVSLGEFGLNFLLLGVVINVGLFLFNLLPIGPLDGMWIVSTFLSEPARLSWIRWNLQFGAMLFLMIVIVGQIMPGPGLIGSVLQPLTERIAGFLIGGRS